MPPRLEALSHRLAIVRPHVSSSQDDSSIQQGNASGSFKGQMLFFNDEGERLQEVPLLQLLRDCKTRWSARAHFAVRS